MQALFARYAVTDRHRSNSESSNAESNELLLGMACDYCMYVTFLEKFMMDYWRCAFAEARPRATMPLGSVLFCSAWGKIASESEQCNGWWKTARGSYGNNPCKAKSRYHKRSADREMWGNT